MTRETMEWLNSKTLIGFTDKRGQAWHHRANLQGDEPNHYPGPIPTEDVERRLFNWEPLVGTVSTELLIETGVVKVWDPDRSAIVRPPGALGPNDKGAILGVHSSNYQVHSYRQWLIQHVEALLDGGLSVGSAGLLRGGAVAWVMIELPETLCAEGFEYRPFLTAVTSLDGTIPTTYNRGATAVVCDNTLSAALRSNNAARIRIKHSAKSLTRFGQVRDALGIVHEVAEEFEAQVKELTNREVTDRQWDQFVNAHSPLVDEKGKPKTGRSLTLARNAQSSLKALWIRDPRVKPWAGTAFGVVQAVNTYAHHYQSSRGSTKTERNTMRLVNGDFDQLDIGTLYMLANVLSAS